MKKTIRQSVMFKASPRDVYEALMDARTHAAFTGGPARISRKVGGKFSVFGGDIYGENLTLVPARTIIQSWRIKGWPKGRTSRVVFSLTRKPGGTRLTFTHSDVPQEAYNAVRKGWKDYYWGPMKELFKKNIGKEALSSGQA